MPELPEVEHVKRGIEPYIKNERIKKVIFQIMSLKVRKTIEKQSLKVWS